MQLLLKPLSHPELGEIVVTEELFPVGRSENPFATYDPDAVVHLSRRHARIFMESGGMYVADLGSRNGTRLNDKPVEYKPVRLLPGDHLSFANQLDYEIVIRGQRDKAQVSDTPGLLLTLIPADGSASVEPVVVTRFPFLVGKSDPAFAVSGDTPQGKLGFLSRRHAHFFCRDGALFIEDLGSTNGTSVNGQRLEEHARQVSDGDLISFGSEHFAYWIKLQIGAVENEEDLSTPGETDGENHTKFITAADSFLDIFCVESAESEPAAEDEVENAEAASTSPAHPTTRPGLFHRLSTFLSELKMAFGSGQRNKPYARWIIAGTLLVAGLLVLGVYFSGKSQRQMKNLLDQERYFESAEMANRYLATHADEAGVQELATEALLNYVLVPWLESVERQAFPQARSVILEARVLATANPESADMLDLLEWLTDLQQFMFERGGAQAPIRVYEHEQQIVSLLQWWDRDAKHYRSTMRLMVNHVPEFAEKNALAFSQLRSLREEKSVYLSAIEKLKATIERKLEDDQPQELATEILRLAEQYTRLGGLDRLQADLELYLAVHHALAEGDRLQAAILIDDAEFATPPFVAKVARLQATRLPSAAVTEQYGRASDAWRAGNLSEALTLLEDLAGQPGGELAARELEARNNIIARYAELQQFRNTPDYGERMLNYYSTLDPEEDGHFTLALAQEFQSHSSSARTRAEAAWNAAFTNWSAYRDGGGIRGLLRLEEQVSPRFTEQARLLSEAYSNANYGAQIFQLLGLEYSQQRGELHRRIGDETALQRRSLEQLSMVLSPEVLDAKLGMLAAPVPTRDSQGRLTTQPEGSSP